MLLLLCATSVLLESFPCVWNHLVWLRHKDVQWPVSWIEEAKLFCCCCGTYLQPVVQSVRAAPYLRQTGFTEELCCGVRQVYTATLLLLVYFWFLFMRPIFSWDHSKLGWVLQRSFEEPLKFSGARFFTGRMPFLSANQQREGGGFNSNESTTVTGCHRHMNISRTLFL